MYRFAVKGGGFARVDPTQVRSILPSGGESSGYSKLVLDGGHSVTVEGMVERLHEILCQYTVAPIAPDQTEESPVSVG